MATLTTDYQLFSNVYVGNFGGVNAYIRLYAKYTSQDTPNNRTYVVYRSALWASANSISTYSGTNKSISGTGIGSASDSCNGTYGAGETTLYETGNWVSHNDAGEASVSASANWYSQPWGMGATASFSASLPTIARASTPSCNNTDLDTAAVIYLNRKSSSFDYKLEYQAEFETAKTLLASGYQQDIFTWNMPSSWYDKIPNKSSFTITIYETTYNNGTQIGDIKTCTFEATVPTTYKPTIANITTDVDALTASLTGTINSVILGYTTLTIGATATTYKSATFTKFIITTGGGISSESTVNPLQKVYNPTTANVFNIVAIDSRGYQSDTYQLTLTTIPYAAPTITGKLYRTTPTTNDAILTANGYYKSGKFGSNTNAQSNSITIKYDYKKQSDTDYTTGGTLSDSDLTLDTNNLKWSITSKSLGSSLFDYKSNYIFRFVLTDKVTSSQETTITLLKGQAGFAEYETHLESDGQLLAYWDDEKLRLSQDLLVGDTTTTLEQINTNTTDISNLTPKIYTFSGSYTSVNNTAKMININVPKSGKYIINMSYSANQGGYADNIIRCGIGNMGLDRDIRQTWIVGATLSNVCQLSSGNQDIAYITMRSTLTVNWAITITYIGQ